MTATDIAAPTETGGRGALDSSRRCVLPPRRTYTEDSTAASSVEQIDRPEPGEGEVLVRVHAAGVDRGVWHLMAGLPYLIRIAGFGVRVPEPGPRA